MNHLAQFTRRRVRGAERFRTALLSILFSFTLSVPAPAQDGDSTSQRILVMGDSLSAFHGIDESEGWVHLLGKAIADEGFEVINRSISGETTYGGLNRISQDLETYAPDYLVIELGANDALRGLDLRQMSDNLARMIETAQAADIPVMLLGMRIPPNYGRAYTEQFHTTYLELAETYGTAIVPFFLEPIALSWDYMQDDGYHPTASAQPLILEHVLPGFREWLQIDGSDLAAGSEPQG